MRTSRFQWSKSCAAPDTTWSQIQETGSAGQAVTDLEVLRFATRERRAVLTPNRRHLVNLHREMPEHACIVACTVDPDFAGQAARIHSRIRDRADLRGEL